MLSQYGYRRHGVRQVLDGAKKLMVAELGAEPAVRSAIRELFFTQATLSTGVTTDAASGLSLELCVTARQIQCAHSYWWSPRQASVSLQGITHATKMLCFDVATCLQILLRPGRRPWTLSMC